MVIANIYWILTVCQALFYFIITATIKGEAIIIPNLWLQKLNRRKVTELAQGNVTSKGQNQRGESKQFAFRIHDLDHCSLVAFL